MMQRKTEDYPAKKKKKKKNSPLVWYPNLYVNQVQCQIWKVDPSLKVQRVSGGSGQATNSKMVSDTDLLSYSTEASCSLYLYLKSQVNA